MMMLLLRVVRSWQIEATNRIENRGSMLTWVVDCTALLGTVAARLMIVAVFPPLQRYIIGDCLRFR